MQMIGSRRAALRTVVEDRFVGKFAAEVEHCQAMRSAVAVGAHERLGLMRLGNDGEMGVKYRIGVYEQFVAGENVERFLAVGAVFSA